MRASVFAGINVILFFIGYAQGQTDDPEWRQFRRLSHRASMTFLLRDSHCIKGQVSDVLHDSVTIKEGNGHGSATSILRTDIIRVTRNGIIYSGRSSWSDIEEISPSTSDRLLVVMKNMDRREGVLIRRLNDALHLHSAGKFISIPKSDISRVYYIRPWPLSDTAAYWSSEGAFWDPEIWFSRAQPSMRILLYDADKSQDDSPAKCG